MLIMGIAPHIREDQRTAPVRINLRKAPPEYHGCFLCGGDPLYTVEWETPGAWWGESHREEYCHSCVQGRGRREGWVREVEVTICSHALIAGERLRRREPHLGDVIVLHRMQRSRQMFGRAFSPHSRRYRVLPLVAR